MPEPATGPATSPAAAATAPANGALPAAPNAASAPAGQGQPAGQTSTTPDVMTVNRAAFAPFGGDYHEAVRAGKAYLDAQQAGLLAPEMQQLHQFCATNGLEPSQVLAFLQANVNGQEPAAAQPTAAPTAQPLSAEAIQKVVESTVTGVLTRQQQAAALQQAQVAEQQFTDQLLRAPELGLYQADGSAGPDLDIARGIFNNCVVDAVRQTLPAYLQGPQRDQAMRDAITRPASREVLEAAQPAFVQRLTGFQQRAVASFAQRQQQGGTPPATLGAGAAGTSPGNGAVPLKDWDNASTRKQAVLGAFRSRHPAGV